MGNPSSSSSLDLSLFLQQQTETASQNANSTAAVSTDQERPSLQIDDDECDFFLSEEPPESGLLQEIVPGLPKKKRQPPPSVYDMEIDGHGELGCHQHALMPIIKQADYSVSPATTSFEYPNSDCNINGVNYYGASSSSAADNFPMVSEGLLEDIIQYRPEFFEILSSRLRKA